MVAAVMGQEGSMDKLSSNAIFFLPSEFNEIVGLTNFIYQSDFKGEQLSKAQSADWLPSKNWTIEKEIKGIKWIKISVFNQQHIPQIVMLYLDQIQDINIYQVSPTEATTTIRAGTLIPFSQRTPLSGKILEGIGNSAQAELQLTQGLTTIYLSINYLFEDTHSSAIQLWPKRIWEEKVPLSREKYLFIQAFLFGALGILSLYHFLIFLQKRDFAFLYYALYNFFTVLVLMTEMGILQLYLFPEQPVYNRIIKDSLVFTLAVTLLYFLFMKTFIGLKEFLPWLNKLVNWYLIIMAPLAFLLIIFYAIFPNKTFQDIGNIFPIITLIMGIICIVAIARTRNKLVWYFIVGSIFLVGGTLLNTLFFLLESAKLMPPLPFPRNYLTEIGIVIELLVFSLGLGYRLRLLEKQKQQVEELGQLKSKFYTNISHEFRTPLTLIIGTAAEVKGNEKEKSVIKRNSNHLLQLINQLLDLSKLESGFLKLHEIQADIVHYLQYLTESFHSMAEEKEVQLLFYAEEKELVMSFDEEKIQQIVYNLLSNAIKFTNKEGKVVFHTHRIDKKNQSFLQIKISDTGVGIAAAELPHIFNRFYQTKTTFDSNKTGTGIGLALTKELVQMMGGQIAVVSEPHKGTEFTLLLPIHHRAILQNPTPNVEQIATIIPSIKPPIGSLMSHPQARPQLLLIEDNTDVSNYIENLLKNDYQIATAQNGQEGIDLALATIPDIIISDVMMPIKDGYAVCQELKTHEQTSHIPIILLTAKATSEDRIKGLKEGADAYLTKPFNKEELFVRLEKLVALRKALQERYATKKLIPISKSDSNSLETIFLQKLIAVVEKRLADPNLSVNDLCQAVNLSNMQVNRKLKALTDRTPSSFIRSIRLEKAMVLFKTTDLNVSEVAYDVGFNDPSYFSRSFSEEFGHPPNVMRK